MKKNSLILIKYGGNAMLSERLKQSVVQDIWKLRSKGYRVVLVHGGGPFIKKMLELVEIESEFIEGHRKTSAEALKYIEMALKGEVNGSLVNLLNKAGLKAGDSIIKMGKTQIDGLDDFDLALRMFSPGEEVEVTVMRDGKRVKLMVKLGKPK